MALVSQFEEWFLRALPAHFPFEGFTHKSTMRGVCRLLKCLELSSEPLNVSDNLSRLKAIVGLISVNNKELW